MPKKSNSNTYNPSDKDKEAITMVAERMEAMKRKRTEYERDWNDADKQRMMHRGDRAKDEWRSDLKLPDTFSIIETAKAEMADKSPGITYRPREQGDLKKAEKHNKIFEFTWEKGNGDLELLKFVDDALVYGLAVGEEYWRQDIREEKSLEDFDLEEFKPKSWTKREVIDFDDVYFKSLPIWSFYWDPMADSLESARDCAKVLVMAEEDFKDKYKKFKNVELVSAGGTTDRPEWFKPLGNMEDHELEVIHYYNKVEDLYLIIANGILLTDADNPIPYKHKDFPFVIGVDILIPHSFVGLGEPKVMRCLQDERDTLRNMRIDTTHLNIQTQYIVDDRLELDDEDLISRPHGILRGPPDAIQAVEKIPIYAEAYKEEEFINDDIIKATGIDIRMQSLSSSGGDTATEVAILKESSLKRIRLKLKLLEKMALHRLGRLRLSNVQQFYSIPKVEKILGGDGKVEETESFRNVGFKSPKGDYRWFTADPEDLIGEYDIIVIPGATLPVSKAMEAQKRVNLFDRLVGHPDIDQRELVSMIIRAHDEDTDKLVLEGENAVVNPEMGNAGGTPAMPPVGVGRSAANQQPRPEQALEGRAASAGGIK